MINMVVFQVIANMEVGFCHCCYSRCVCVCVCVVPSGGPPLNGRYCDYSDAGLHSVVWCVCCSALVNHKVFVNLLNKVQLLGQYLAPFLSPQATVALS